MKTFEFIKPVTKFAKDHSNVILTVAGSAGVVATTLSAVKDTKKHELNIADAEYDWSKRDTDEPLPKKERFVVALKSYWPTIILGAATVTCFVANGVISEKKIAGLGTAYNVAVTSFNEYKKSVGKRLKETDISEMKKEEAQPEVVAQTSDPVEKSRRSSERERVKHCSKNRSLDRCSTLVRKR